MPLDTNREEQVLYPPVESCACPAGYAGGIFGDTYTDKVKPEVLYRLSAMILRDELAIRDLSERVYFTPQGYQSIAPKIQRLANYKEISSKSVPDVSVSSASDQQQEQLEGSAKDLEMLAQEIYCLLKQRI